MKLVRHCARDTETHPKPNTAIPAAIARFRSRDAMVAVRLVKRKAHTANFAPSRHGAVALASSRAEKCHAEHGDEQREERVSEHVRGPFYSFYSALFGSAA